MNVTEGESPVADALRTVTEALRKAAATVREARAAGVARRVPATAVKEYQAALDELETILRAAVSRGRPKDTALEEDRRMQALEYYDLRLNGTPSKLAISIVLGERVDGSGFEHPRRRPRSQESFLRDMRARWGQVSNLLDLITTATPEQIAALREEFDNKSKPKSARTRK